jgi:hypothetical protein
MTLAAGSVSGYAASRSKRSPGVPDIDRSVAQTMHSEEKHRACALGVRGTV